MFRISDLFNLIRIPGIKKMKMIILPILIIACFLIILTSQTAAASIERTATTDTVCDNGFCTKSLYSTIMNYLFNGEYVQIETKILPSSDPLFEYEVTKGVYQSYFKEDPTQGQVVKYVKDDVEVTFQPMALNYRNDLSQLQQINMIQSVTGIANENEFTYEDAYGSGLNLSYKYFNEILKEELTLDNFSVLPSPEQYIIDGGNPTLDLDFVLGTNAQHIVIDGFEWDKKTQTTTQSDVYIKDDEGNILYYLPKPYAYDSNYSEQLLTYEFKKSGNKLYVILKTNYSWLEHAVYPVRIDPTIKLDDTIHNIKADHTFSETFQNYGFDIRINITDVPLNATITDARLSVYWKTVFGIPDNDATIDRIGNQTWVEGTCPLGGTTNQTNKTWSSTAQGTRAWINVTKQVKVDNSNSFTSLRIIDPDKQTDDSSGCFDDSDLILGETESTSLVAEDREAGNQNSPYLNVTYAWDIPKVTLHFPTNDSTIFFKDRPSLFNFTINDSTFTMANATFWWNYSGTWQQNITNSATLTVGDGTTMNLTVNLTRGDFIWNIKVCNVNNECSFADENWTIHVNNSVPNAPTLIYPTDSATVSTAITWLNFSTTDDDNIHINNDTIFYYLYADQNADPTTLVYNDTDQFFNYTGLGDGETHYWKVHADDSFGNSSNSSTFSFSVSTSVPAITIYYPTNNSWNTSSTTINFSFMASDSDGIDSCSLYINSTGWHLNQSKDITSDVRNNFTLALEDETEYSYNIFCNDTGGAESYYAFGNTTFGIDTIKPNLTVTSPTATTYTSKTISILHDTNDTFYSNCTYNIYQTVFWPSGSSETNGNVSCNSSFTVSAFTNYVFNIYATDLATNINSTQINFTTEEATPPPPGSGGGGPTILAPEKVIEPIKKPAIVLGCGNNFCDDDENPLSCPEDCRLFSIDEMFCLPLFKCGNWEKSWFVNSIVVLVLIGMVYGTYKAKKVKRPI